MENENGPEVSPSRWAPIEEAIHEFQAHLAQHVPQFKIENGVDCAESYPGRKAASLPLTRKGVYLIFDDSESLVYIGVTIMRPLSERIRDHRTSKLFTPRWIDVIPFDWEWAFFAPSLEEFLLKKFSLMKGCALVNREANRLEIIIDVDEL